MDDADVKTPHGCTYHVIQYNVIACHAILHVTLHCLIYITLHMDGVDVQKARGCNASCDPENAQARAAECICDCSFDTRLTLNKQTLPQRGIRNGGSYNTFN